MEKFPATEAIKDVKAGKAVVLDVRTEAERAEAFIPGSLHISVDKIADGQMPDVPKDKTIYVHCSSGGRSEYAKEKLLQEGFKSVHNIGGLDDWKDAGGPVETSS